MPPIPSEATPPDAVPDHRAEAQPVQPEVRTGRLSVNAVVLDDRGRVLLGLRDAPPVWNLPGGGVEPGETLWDAAVREVREEVAVDVEVERLTGVYDRTPNGSPVLVFRCRLLGGVARAAAETVEVGWFAPDDLPEPMHPYQPLRLADAVRDEPLPALRHQPGPSLRTLFPDPPAQA